MAFDMAFDIIFDMAFDILFIVDVSAILDISVVFDISDLFVHLRHPRHFQLAQLCINFVLVSFIFLVPSLFGALKGFVILFHSLETSSLKII